MSNRRREGTYLVFRLLALNGGAGHIEGEGVAVFEEVTEQQQRFLIKFLPPTQIPWC